MGNVTDRDLENIKREFEKILKSCDQTLSRDKSLKQNRRTVHRTAGAVTELDVSSATSPPDILVNSDNFNYTLDENNYPETSNEQKQVIAPSQFVNDATEEHDDKQYGDRNPSEVSEAGLENSEIKFVTIATENVPLRKNESSANHSELSDTDLENAKFELENIFRSSDQFDNKKNLEVGMRFSNKEEMSDFIQSYCNTNMSPLIIRTTDKKNKAMLLRMVFKCPHGIERKRSKSAGKKEREKKEKNAFVGCPVQVNVNQQASDGSFLVMKADLEHKNHETGDI